MGVRYEFGAGASAERRGLWGGYSVGRDGSVWSGGMELRKSRGVYVRLRRDGRTCAYLVRYLVARAFVPNPECRPYVVRVDPRGGDSADNLEWVEDDGRRRRGPERRVECVRGGVSRVFGSVAEASRETGVYRAGIRRCLAGWQRSCLGFEWRYLDED
jgi:hypothetical protein